jgi:tape measure domain-containing protein
MAITVASLRALIGLDASGFSSGVNAVKSGAADAAGSMSRLREALNDTGAGMESVSSAVEKLKNSVSSASPSVTKAATDLQKAANAADKWLTEIKQLDAESSKAGEALKKTGEGAKKAASDLDRLDAAAKRAKADLRELQANAMTVGSFLQGMGAALTAGLTLPIVAAGVASVKAATDFDSLQRGLLAVSGSAEEAAYQTRRLREVAKLPGLSFEDALRGAINLQAAGINASLAERSLKAFGNALATVGKGKADLDGVNIALVQIANKGKVMAQDIRQLQERVPQISEAMRAAFGTANTEELQALGLTSKRFIAEIVNELEKAPKVAGGALTSFENLADSVKIAFGEIGKSILPTLVPILGALAASAEYVARIFTQLPEPVKATIITLSLLLAVAGPLVVVVGTLIAAVGNVSQAWVAFVALKPAISAFFAQATTQCIGLNMSLVQNAVALNTAKGAWLAFGAGLGAALAGITIGTIINDAFITSIDRARQKVEDETKAQLASIPYLEKAYNARKKLADLDRIIAESGNVGLRNSNRYKEVQKAAEFYTEEYQKAADAMKREFDSAAEKMAAENAERLAKSKEKFAKAVADANEELAKLKVPDILGKLKIENPDIDETEVKKLAVIKEQIEATKKLQEAQKQAREDAARSLKQFKDQIAEAKQDIAELRAGSTYERIKATAPKGTPDALIRELAALKDQAEALKKAKESRDEEREKIEDVQKKLDALNGTMRRSSGAIDGFNTSLQNLRVMAATPPAFVGPPAGLVAPPVSLPSAPGRRLPAVRPASGGYSTATPMARQDRSWRSYNGPPLPDIYGGGGGSQLAEQTTVSVQKMTPAVTQATAAVKALGAAAGVTGSVLVKELGADTAEKVIENVSSLKRELGILTAQGDKNKVAFELTGKAYDDLGEASRGLIDRSLSLRRAIAAHGELKKLGDAWNEQRIAMLKNAATSEEQRIALDVMKRSFASLGPDMQLRIREMADWKRQTDEAKKAQDQLTKTQEAVSGALIDARMRQLEAGYATDAHRIAIGFFKDRLKEVPPELTTIQSVLGYLKTNLKVNTDEAIKTAEAIAKINAELLKDEAAKKFTEGLEKATSSARLKFLQFKAATEAESIALGFFEDRLKDLPASVTTAAQALDLLSQAYGKDVEAARKAGAEIEKFNKGTKTFNAKDFIPNLQEVAKWFDNLGKSVKNFQEDMAQNLATARRHISGLYESDPAQAAWLDYLEKNKTLAEAIKNGFIDAGAAQRDFKTQFEAGRLAEVMTTLRQKQAEANKELREAQGPVSEYNRILQELGLTAGMVDSRVDAMIQSIVKTRQEAQRLAELKEIFNKVAQDLSGIFENALGQLYENGFKGFFDSVISGFTQMLNRMAAEFLASQLQKLLLNFIGSALGGFGGGGAGSGLGDFNSGAFAGYAANGGPVVSGKSYMVGERGPEMFVPPSSGRIIPNHELGGSTVINYSPTYHIDTPDANSFRRSQRQLMDDGLRQAQRLRKRNG